MIDFSKKNHIDPKKSLGQNFLKDDTVIKKIIAAFEGIYDHGPILEIGPGMGALTNPLVTKFHEALNILEIDTRLFNRFRNDGRFKSNQLICADALTYDIEKHFEGFKPYHVISNLPYNVATPIIIKLLMSKRPCVNLLLMVQKEVAMQLCALDPSKKSWGRLSIFAKYFCEKRTYLFDVLPSAFFPEPKIISGIIHLKPHTHALSHENWFCLEQLIAAGFQQRRKSINNALKSFEISKAMFDQASIDSVRRAESLDLHEWICLEKIFSKNKKAT